MKEWFTRERRFMLLVAVMLVLATVVYPPVRCTGTPIEEVAPAGRHLLLTMSSEETYELDSGRLGFEWLAIGLLTAAGFLAESIWEWRQ